MNRIHTKLKEDKKILSIYFTAGFPALKDTCSILRRLEKEGVDMIEIGLPFSDPLADGPTIQASSTKALKNGMTTELLFSQLKDIRKVVSIPLILMGYFNPILQFGVEQFCKQCAAVGIDGLIIPDLPAKVYEEKYNEIFEKNNLLNILLITPQTNNTRVRQLDEISNGFIYMVSSASTTGSQGVFGKIQENYFKRIESLKLKNPTIVGFGISDKISFNKATQHAKGAIIGSAFIKHLENHGLDGIPDFIEPLLS